jgi:hypothetical protein
MKRLLTPVLFLALCTSFVAPAATHAALLSPDTDPRTFVLNASDLGSGFRMNSEQSGTRPNEAASNREDVARYQQWGRISGYNAQFEREPNLISSLTQTVVVMQAVSLYRTPDGAQAAFDYSRQRNGQTMEMLGTPQVGEASLAFRIRQQAGQDRTQSGTPAEAVVIQFRKGNLTQSIVASGPQGAPVLEDAMTLAQLAATRVPD